MAAHCKGDLGSGVVGMAPKKKATQAGRRDEERKKRGAAAATSNVSGGASAPPSSDGGSNSKKKRTGGRQRSAASVCCCLWCREEIGSLSVLKADMAKEPPGRLTRSSGYHPCTICCGAARKLRPDDAFSAITQETKNDEGSAA